MASMGKKHDPLKGILSGPHVAPGAGPWALGQLMAPMESFTPFCNGSHPTHSHLFHMAPIVCFTPFCHDSHDGLGDNTFYQLSDHPHAFPMRHIPGAFCRQGYIVFGPFSAY